MDKIYPNTVSRTLNPEQKSLSTIIGRHDKRLTDAELNLIQDVQDLKRTKILNNTTFSGCLSYDPFIFNTSTSSTLQLKAFDVLFNGEVVTIGGNLSSDISINNVNVPQPIQWDGGSTNDDAAIYVVYLEIWLKSLVPETGAGYGVISGVNYFYPNGAVDANPSIYILDDTVDPFLTTATSSRAQIQWAIRTARLPLSYNFDKYAFGLDPAILPDTGIVYGRGSIASNSSPSSFSFTNMGSINGDTGLWRAGDGNIQNTLQTMDGYTYAMPLCVFFQRNTGFYSIDNNPYGCGSSSAPFSGLIATGVSGRLDGKFADVVYPDDLVDTRMTVSLTGYDYTNMLQRSFTDLISGQTNIRIARGESPGSKTTLLGSSLEYAITVGPTTLINTDNIADFDGIQNGFSSDQRTYNLTTTYTTSQKASGSQGSSWVQGDSIVLQLTAAVPQLVTITNVKVQSFHTNADGSLTPINLFGGQVAISGVGTRIVNVSIAQNLVGTLYDPGDNPLIVTFTTLYPAALGQDLRKVPKRVLGGALYDVASNISYPVFGVSDFLISDSTPPQVVSGIESYNPSYSNLTFGTRALIPLNASQGTVINTGNNSVTNFIIPGTKIDNRYLGGYVVSVKDSITKAKYTITSTAFDGVSIYVTVNGTVTAGSSVILEVLLYDTCQVGYTAAVKGITSIEEIVMVGNYSGSDPRVTIAQIKTQGSTTKILLYTNGCIIKGIAGDDTNRYLFVLDIASGSFKSVLISSVEFNSGIVTITVPSSINLTNNNQFRLFVSLLPSMNINSSMSLITTYRPYQGEGVLNRDYTIIDSDQQALLTSNGTGAAPLIGIKDVYPYNRDLPIATTLPSLITWSDSSLQNQPLVGDISNNFEDKRASNIEHTIPVQLYSNDFIEPISGFKRKRIRLTTKGGSRGFNGTLPNVGYGIKQPATKTVIGSNLLSTIAAVTLYIDKLNGNDNNDGLSATTAKASIFGAISALPPVIKHPVTIFLIDADGNQKYSIADFTQSQLDVTLFGDGITRSLKYYSLANLGFIMQDEARLTISKLDNALNNIKLDGGSLNYGDGPISAFTITKTRVIFNGIDFSNFAQQALYIVDSDVDLLNCSTSGNLQGFVATNGSNLVLSNGTYTVGGLGNLAIVTGNSNLTVTNPTLIVQAGTVPDAFFVADRNSNITLTNHDSVLNTSLEQNIVATTNMVKASLSSSVSCSSNWRSNGYCSLTTNSVLLRSIAVQPFVGGILNDVSSSVITN